MLRRSSKRRGSISQKTGSKARIYVLLGGLMFNMGFLIVLAHFGEWATMFSWICGVLVFFPFFGALRQLLEHRGELPTIAGAKAETICLATNRLFGDGPLANTLGGAGFNRHLLHHWDPQVSYTRLRELEEFLLETQAGPYLRERNTTYLRTFTQLFSFSGGDTLTPTCLSCGAFTSEKWAEGSDQEYLTTTDVFSYYRCGACGALSIDPIPRDQLSQIYPANYYSFDEKVTGSWSSKAKDWLDQRFYRKFLSELAPSRLDVLDVGGGSGAQLTVLRSTDPRIVRTAVVDLDQNAGESARRQGHEYFCGRFEDYSPSRTFDVILMLNLIEHVDNPGELLRKAHSLLSPHGIVIIKTPNTDSLDARLFRNRNWGGYHCPRHWVLFNRENMTAAVERAGFKIHYFQYTQGAPFWTTSILFALSRGGWIHVSRERPIPRHPLFPVLSVAFAALDLVRSKVAKTSQMQLILKRC